MGKLRIVSRSSQPFRDRQEAGRLLARELAEWRGQRPVVLGIPRGGIIVAQELARELAADLDIVLAHKLRTPGHPELAMGSVAEGGKLFLNKDVVREIGVSQTFIEREKAAQLAEMTRRIDLIRRVLPKIPLAGRVVIVTDDGVATGATTQAALWAVHQEQPSHLVAALPVGAEATVRRLVEDVDEVVCLRTPPDFAAVGQFYRNFEPVEDEEMLQILAEEQVRRSKAGRLAESHG